MSAHLSYQDNEIAIVGVLNFTTVVNLWKESIALLAKQKSMRINLQKVTEVNSAGLALLLEWVKYSKINNSNISFENIPEQLTSLAKIAGVNSVLF